MVWLLIILIFVLSIIYLIIRNKKVDTFRYDIARLLSYHDEWREADLIFQKVGYVSMLLNFKPLKLESFYTTEECRTIRGRINPQIIRGNQGRTD